MSSPTSKTNSKRTIEPSAWMRTGGHVPLNRSNAKELQLPPTSVSSQLRTLAVDQTYRTQCIVTTLHNMNDGYGYNLAEGHHNQLQGPIVNFKVAATYIDAFKKCTSYARYFPSNQVLEHATECQNIAETISSDNDLDSPSAAKKRRIDGNETSWARPTLLCLDFYYSFNSHLHIIWHGTHSN